MATSSRWGPTPFLLARLCASSRPWHALSAHGKGGCQARSQKQGALSAGYGLLPGTHSLPDSPDFSSAPHHPKKQKSLQESESGRLVFEPPLRSSPQLHGPCLPRPSSSHLPQRPLVPASHSPEAAPGWVGGSRMASPRGAAPGSWLAGPAGCLWRPGQAAAAHGPAGCAAATTTPCFLPHFLPALHRSWGWW